MLTNTDAQISIKINEKHNFILKCILAQVMGTEIRINVGFNEVNLNFLL